MNYIIKKLSNLLYRLFVVVQKLHCRLHYFLVFFALYLSLRFNNSVKIACFDFLSPGVICGDEILALNSQLVRDLDMLYIESVLAQSLSLCMTLRASRSQRHPLPHPRHPLSGSTDSYINKLVVPVPPTESSISDEAIGQLICPKPGILGKTF